MNKETKLSDFLTTIEDRDLATLLLAIAKGCKVISHLVNNAGFSDILGANNSTNVHGEEVQKLDDLSNKILLDYLHQSRVCGGYLSEETEGIETLNANGRFTVAVDPLDGSSNIEVAAPIGTIFAVNERVSPAGDIQEADFLQHGYKTKAAGYVIYGSSTLMVVSTGQGVQGFMLRTSDNEFYLTHPDIRITDKGKVYSINHGNALKFDDGVKAFIEHCHEKDKDSSRPYSLRYIGSMVGDVHRNLLKGGIFIYPAAKGEAKGKLRLLYECIPMAYITEQAGGQATDGKQRILDLLPVELHERAAIFIGSKNLVEKAMHFLNR